MKVFLKKYNKNNISLQYLWHMQKKSDEQTLLRDWYETHKNHICSLWCWIVQRKFDYVLQVWMRPRPCRTWAAATTDYGDILCTEKGPLHCNADWRRDKQQQVRRRSQSVRPIVDLIKNAHSDAAAMAVLSLSDCHPSSFAFGQWRAAMVKGPQYIPIRTFFWVSCYLYHSYAH